MHRVPGLVHVVVVAVLAPFAHADRLVRSLQLHDQARPVAPLHLVDLAVSLTVSDTLAHGLVHHLGRQREIGQTEPKEVKKLKKVNFAVEAMDVKPKDARFAKLKNESKDAKLRWMHTMD